MFIFLLSITLNATELHLRMDTFTKSLYSGKIYLTTDNGGLVSFNPEDSSWNWVNAVSGLPSNNTKDLFVRNDSVFVLSGGGISILDKDFSFISSQNFNPLLFVADTNPVSIYINDDNVILGGKGSVQWFNLNHFGNIGRQVEYEDYNFNIFEILPLDTCYLFGTDRGLFKVDTNFQDTVLIDSTGETYSIFVSGNSMWIGGSWGCKEITGDSAVFSEDTVWTIGKINEDIYIGTKRGLYRYDGGWNRIHGGDVRGFARVFPQDLRVSAVRGHGLLFEGPWNFLAPPGLASNMVADMVQTPDGKIYLSHKDTKKISVFDGDEWNILNGVNSWNFPGGDILNIESDSEGRIYFGFWYWEQVPILYCWDTVNDTMPKPIQLPIDATTVTGMAVDSNDDLWVGLFRVPKYGEGNWVLKMHRENGNSLEWTRYQNPGIVWKRVFAEGSEGMYCGNSPPEGGVGIHVLGEEENEIESVTGSLGSGTISMCSDLNGNIWAGLEDKLIYISDVNVEKVESPNKFEGLAVDFQGGLWCYNSTEGMSYRNPEGIWQPLPQALTNLKTFPVKDIISHLHFTENNNLFVCTYNGLYEFELGFNQADSGKIKVYPNPFNYEKHNMLNFSARDLGGKEIFIYDIIGTMKGEYEVPEGNDILSIDVDLSSGLYMFFVTENDQVIHKGKFAVVR